MTVVDYLTEHGMADVLASWDDPVDPASVAPGSHLSVLWRCENGHTWRSRVFSRVLDGVGCPICKGKKIVPGVNDMATTNPELAAEWDEERNGAPASTVSAGANRKAWWRCELGHSYEMPVYSRKEGGGCPYCKGKKTLRGFNDLATTDPLLAAEWDADKNGKGPEEFNRGSHKRAWWRCPLGHSYEAEIYARAAGNGCPYCAGRRTLAGFNDLATTHPAVAKQWSYELNGNVTPEMITKGSNKKFWWRCSEGHVWKAAVFSRTRKRASDCPVCAGTVKQGRSTRCIRPSAKNRRAAAERSVRI